MFNKFLLLVIVVVCGLGMLFNTSPLGAQEAPAQGSINPNYNPVVGQLTRAFVIQKFDRAAYNRKQDLRTATVYILDVDGDGRTTNDQKFMQSTAQFNKGDLVQFIETQFSIRDSIIYDTDGVSKTR